MTKNSKPEPRSQAWWDDPTAFMERFFNHDLTREGRQSASPSSEWHRLGSDLVPCNCRAHIHVEPLEKVSNTLDHLLQGKVKGRTVWLVGHDLLSHI